MADRSDMETRLFRMLGEANPASPAIWTEDEIDDAIARAIEAYEEICPLKTRTVCFIQKESHKVDDETNVVTSADASDQTSVNTLLNEIKSDYNTHRASTTYHRAADSTNAVSSSDASNLATSLTLANEIKADFNAHLIQSGSHMTDDLSNFVYLEDAVDLTTVEDLANQLKSKYNEHVANEESGREVYVYSVIGDSSFLRIEAVEYPVNLFPKQSPQFDYPGFGNFLSLQTDYTPGNTGELVFVYWHKKHTFDDTTSTIKQQHYYIVEIGAQAEALLLKALDNRILAQSDLATARTEIAKIITGGATNAAAIITLLGGVATYIADANTAYDKLASTESTITTLLGGNATYRGDADTALNKIDTGASNIATAIAAIATELGLENTALDAVATALGGSTYTDLLDKIDTATTGYIDIIDAALDKIDTYVAGASAPSANKYLDDGDAYLTGAAEGDEVSKTHVDYANASLGMARGFAEEANARYNQIKGIIEDVDQRVGLLRTYVAEAEGRFSTARGYAEQVNAYLQKLNVDVGEASGRLGIVEAINAEVGQYLGLLNLYINEGAGRIQMSKTFIDEAGPYLEVLKLYVSESQSYQANATQQMYLADGFLNQGLKLRATFLEKLKTLDLEERQREKPQNILPNLWMAD